MELTFKGVVGDKRIVGSQMLNKLSKTKQRATEKKFEETRITKFGNQKAKSEKHDLN